MLKKLFENKKILKIIFINILILIILSGILMIMFKGLKYDLIYDENKQIEIYFEKTIEKKELNKMLEEVFAKQEILIQKLNSSEKYLLITVKDLTEEQKEILVQKINEKNTQNQMTTNDLVIYENEKINLIETYNKYIFSIIISFVLIIIYLLIRYNKLGKIKIVGYTLGSIILTQCIYISVLAIIQIPINVLTIPISLNILFINIFILTIIFEKKHEKIKQIDELNKNIKKKRIKK